MIMGKNISYSNERSIVAYQNDIELFNNTIISSMQIENIKVSITPKSTQAVFIISGGTFINGNCNGTRTNLNNSTLNIISQETSIDTNEIKIIGLYAKSYDSGVKIIDPFYLYYDFTNEIETKDHNLINIENEL